MNIELKEQGKEEGKHSEGPFGELGKGGEVSLGILRREERVGPGTVLVFYKPMSCLMMNLYNKRRNPGEVDTVENEKEEREWQETCKEEDPLGAGQ